MEQEVEITHTKDSAAELCFAASHLEIAVHFPNETKLFVAGFPGQPTKSYLIYNDRIMRYCANCIEPNHHPGFPRINAF